MSRESKQYSVTLTKAFNILIDKLEEKIDQSQEVIRTSCEHVAEEEQVRLQRLENLHKKVSKRKVKIQKGIVTG